MARPPLSGGNLLKLTAAQRNAIFRALRGEAKDFPKLGGEGTAPVSAGHTIPLSSRVTIIVRQVDRPSPNRWELAYTIEDHRDEPGLARTGRKVAVDVQGNPAPMTSDEEHGYGGHPRFGLDAGPRVSPYWQDKFTRESREGWTQYVNIARADEVRNREMLSQFNTARRLHKEALRKGIDLREPLCEFIEQATERVRSKS